MANQNSPYLALDTVPGVILACSFLLLLLGRNLLPEMGMEMYFLPPHQGKYLLLDGISLEMVLLLDFVRIR